MRRLLIASSLLVASASHAEDDLGRMLRVGILSLYSSQCVSGDNPPLSAAYQKRLDEGLTRMTPEDVSDAEQFLIRVVGLKMICHDIAYAIRNPKKD